MGTLSRRLWMTAALGLASAIAGTAVSFPSRPAPSGTTRPDASSYPADLGPRSLGTVASAIPPDMAAGYDLTRLRCGACHTPARAFHHRYAEPEGRDLPDKEAGIASLKTEHPEFFGEPWVWQVEADVWKRCVDRMAAKPSSGISDGDSRAIHAFLAWDSSERKLGRRAPAWKALRVSLLRKFKAADPRRYRELEAKDAL